MPKYLRSILLLVAVGLPVPGQAQRPITSEDYYTFKSVGDPALSPDGSQVVYSVTRVERQLNRRMTTIWLVPGDASSPPRQLTASDVSSSAPKWSPDGKSLAFISSRPVAGDPASTRSQLYLLRLDGGEPRRVTSFSNGVNGCD